MSSSGANSATNCFRISASFWAFPEWTKWTFGTVVILRRIKPQNHRPLQPRGSGIDPVGGEVVPLFYPRRDRWSEYFLFRGGLIEGITPIERATVTSTGVGGSVWTRALH